MKKVAGTLRLDLSSYHELESFAQFGSDLDEATKAKLDRGRRTEEVLKQPVHSPVAVQKQVLILFALTRGFLDKIAVDDIKEYEASLSEYFDANHSDLLQTIKEKGTLPDEDTFKSAVSEFTENFLASKSDSDSKQEK